MNQASTKKMTPGDDMHLTLLMAPHNLNLVTGQDRQHLLAFGRAAFEAGQRCQGCSVPPNGLHQIAEPSHSMSQYASKDDMLKAVMAENEQLKVQLAAAQQGVQPVLGWVHKLANGKISSHFYKYEPHCDNAVRDNGGEKIAVVAAAHPTTQGLDAQAIERAAQKLAEIAEYNWAQLTEKQREEFRTDALSALTAALGLGHE